jgi:hypothetical protein
MTQAQHSQISTFLTQTCGLVETAFIQEMTDHFVASIEEKMAESLSFEKALKLTIEEFGGPKNLQKLEWNYRKVFLKSQIRYRWTLVKRQFAKPKRLRTLAVVSLVTLLSLNFGWVSDFMGITDGNGLWLWFTVMFWSFILGIMLILFLLQRIFPSFKKVGVVRSPGLIRILLSFLLWATAWLLFSGIHALQMPMLLKGLAYSTLWSTLAVLFLGSLDYVQETDPDSKYYQMR